MLSILYFVFTMLTIFTVGNITIYVGQRRHMVGGINLFLVLGSCLFTCSTELLIMLSPVKEIAYVFAQLQALGPTLIAIHSLLFALEYTRNPPWKSRKLRFALYTWLVIHFTMIWTDPYHHLYFHNFSTVQIARLTFWVRDTNIWFVFASITSLFIHLSGIFLLWSHVSPVHAPLRKQQILILWGVSVPVLTGVISSVFINVGLLKPIYHPYILSFLIAAVLIRSAVFRYNFFLLSPTAHKKVFDDLPDVVLVLNETGRITDLNATARTLFPHHKLTLLGLTLADVYPEIRSQHVPDDTLIELSIEGKRHYFEQRNREISYQDVVGYLIRLHDVTEHKQVEQALQKSEELYRLLANNISDMVTLHMPDGRFLYASPSYTDAIGYTSEELLSMPVECLSTLVHPDDLQQTHDEAHQQVLRGETITRLEFQRKKKDGTYFWVQAHSAPIFDDNGQIVRVIASSRDITERKQSEARLSRTEQHFSLLVNSVHDYAIYTLDVDGTIMTWNPAAERIKGYKAEEIIGRNYASFYMPEDISREEPQRILNITSQEGRFAGEGWRVRKNGTRFWAEVAVSVLCDESGNVIGFSKVTRDLTQRKQIEDTLQRQNNYLNSLHNIMLDLLNRHTIDDLLQAIVDDASLLLDAPYGELMLKEGDMLVVRAFTANQPFLQGDRVKRGEALLSWQAHDTLQPAIWEDYSLLPNKRELYNGLKLRAVADFPITMEGACIGVLALARSIENTPFTTDQIQLGMMLSHLAALVVDNVAQYNAALQEIAERKKTENRLNSLTQELQAKNQTEYEQRVLAETLRDTIAALNSTLELDEILKCILDNIGRIIPHDTASIMLVNDGMIRVVQHTDWSSTEMNLHIKVEFPLRQIPHLNLMYQTHQSCIIDDIDMLEDWREMSSSYDSLSYLAAPICVDDQVIGFFNMGSMSRNHFTPYHSHRLQVFVNHAAVALKNAQLYKQSLELAAMEERQRLARDLHDSVTQTLFAASVTAKAIVKQWNSSKDGIGDELLELSDLTQGALAEMRTLLLELRPNALLSLNLNDLLRQLSETIKGRARLKVYFKSEGQYDHSHHLKIAFFRIAQEALNNVIKHARADHLSMHLTCASHRVEMRIIDDGCGFSLTKVQSGHFGLEIMKERALEAEIDLQILTNHDQGTVVTAIWIDKDKHRE